MSPTKEKYKYEYQGQEHQTELGLNWSSFKYRNYDSIGRFMSVDPLAEITSSQSPYAISNNNPTLYKDYLGLGIFNVIGNLFRRIKNGIHNLFSKCWKSYEMQSVREAWQTPDFNLHINLSIFRKQNAQQSKGLNKPVAPFNKIKDINPVSVKTEPSIKNIPFPESSNNSIPTFNDIPIINSNPLPTNIAFNSITSLDPFGNIQRMETELSTDNQTINDLNQIINILTHNRNRKIRFDFPRSKNEYQAMTILARKKFNILARYLINNGVQPGQILYGFRSVILHFEKTNLQGPRKETTTTITFY